MKTEKKSVPFFMVITAFYRKKREGAFAHIVLRGSSHIYC